MKVRYYIPVVLLLALVAFLALILNLEYFNITRLEFEGNERYSDAILLKNTNLKTGENGFKQLFDHGGKVYLLRFTKEEEYLKEIFPYIKKIEITYRLPNLIKYNIEEGKSIFYTAYLGTYLLLDYEGTVLEVTDNVAKDELILLSGISFTTFKTGRKLDLDDKKKLDTSTTVYHTVKKIDEKNKYIEEFLPLIKEISFADKKNIHILLENNIVAIIPADDNIGYNVTSLMDIYFKSLQVKGNGILDFTGSDPVFIPYKEDRNTEETTSAQTG